MIDKTNFDYEFTKMFSRIETSVFKLKDVTNIDCIIKSGRLRNFMEFESYGEIEYDPEDIQLFTALVKKMEKFNRLRTNVMIYNLFNNDWNPGIYNKLFIIKQNNVKAPTFSYILYNTETGVSAMMPAIDYEYDTLVRNIIKSFNTIHRRKLIDYYSRKADACKKTDIANIPTQKEFEKIWEEFNNTELDNRKTAILKEAI